MWVGPGACITKHALKALFAKWVCGWWCGVLCEKCIVDASIHHMNMLCVCLCGLFNFSYFFCENVTYHLWLVCGLVFFIYGCSPPCALCGVCGVCVCYLRAHGGCLGMLDR